MKEPAMLAELSPFGKEGFNPDTAAVTFSAYAPSPGEITVKEILKLLEKKGIKDFF